MSLCPFEWSCKDGNIRAFKRLLKGVNVKRERQSGLIIACRRGNIKIVKLLLDHGVDVNCTDKNGYTPLLASCECKNKDIVKLLLARGADINIKGPWRFQGSFATACLNNDVEMIKLLINHNVDMNQKGLNGLTGFMVACYKSRLKVIYFLIDKIDLEDIDNTSNTALILSCQWRATKSIKILLQNKANVNHKNKYGHNCFLIACMHNYKDIVLILINYKADLYQRCIKEYSWGEYDGYTGFMIACFNKHYNIVKLLMINGVNIKHRDNCGRSILKIMFEKYNELIHEGQVDIKNKTMDIIKLIVSYCIDYKRDMNDIDEKDMEVVKQYMKTEEHKILRDSFYGKMASEIFSAIVLLSDNYYAVK